MKRTVVRVVAGALSLVVLGATSRASQAQEAGGGHLELPQLLERGSEGSTLLLIPCAGCGARSWNEFLETNEDRFRMIAVTLPGLCSGHRTRSLAHRGVEKRSKNGCLDPGPGIDAGQIFARWKSCYTREPEGCRLMPFTHFLTVARKK